MGAWKQYISHKIVQAAPIVSVGAKSSDGTNTILGLGGNEVFSPNEQVMADKAKVGDYAVIYADGYKSVSPKAAFEEGYSPHDDTTRT